MTQEWAVQLLGLGYPGDMVLMWDRKTHQSDHTLQDRMSNNLVEAALAGRSANTALSWGEQWLLSRPGSERPAACTDTCTQADIIRAQGGHGSLPEHQNLNWWRLNAHSTGKDPLTGAIVDEALVAQGAHAYWLIEEVHLSIDTQADDTKVETAYYRILARGAGRDPAVGSSRRPSAGHQHCLPARIFAPGRRSPQPTSARRKR